MAYETADECRAGFTPASVVEQAIEGFSDDQLMDCANDARAFDDCYLSQTCEAVASESVCPVEYDALALSCAGVLDAIYAIENP